VNAKQKLQAGATMPRLTLPKVGGGDIALGGEGRWQMVVVYRGKHCPLCRRYLKTLDDLLEDFRSIGTEVVAVSGDPKDKAEAEVTEEGWRFPVAYNLSPDQMRTLGLYISEPRSPRKPTGCFPSPASLSSTPRARHTSSTYRTRHSRGPTCKGCSTG
jgi:peroxiredoxin